MNDDDLDEVLRVQRSLNAEREANARLRLKLQKAQEDRDALTERLNTSCCHRIEHTTDIGKPGSTPSSPSCRERIKRLEAELVALQELYDELLATHTRQEDRYKVDYQRWRDVKKWLFDEETDSEQWTTKGLKLHEGEKSEEERRKRLDAKIWKKRERLVKKFREMKRSPVARTREDKENIRPFPSQNQGLHTGVGASSRGSAPRHDRKRRRLNDDSAPLKAPSRSALVLTSPLSELPKNAIADPLLPSAAATAASITPFSTNSSPTVCGTVLPCKDSFDAKMTPCPVKRPALSPLGPQHTNDIHRHLETSVFDRLSYKRKRPEDLAMMLPTEIPNSSDTEDDSQAPDPVSDPPIPEENPAQGHRKANFALHEERSSSSLVRRKSPLVNASEQINKEDKTIHPHLFENHGSDTTIQAVSDSGKGEQPEPDRGTHHPSPRDVLQTPAIKALSSSTNKLTDYSAYKGRGRYAQQLTSTGGTINAHYAIDPSRNEGRDFQFRDVVRKKAERRRLDAEDCDCCRDYYEAVGPLPNRLQPPLWRSPESTPDKKCRRHEREPLEASNDVKAARRADVVAHKQAISRHRQRWVRPQTPPGYWNIGFPTTQEAKEINERAAEMHEAKRRTIEAEAARGNGKYIRR